MGRGQSVESSSLSRQRPVRVNRRRFKRPMATLIRQRRTPAIRRNRFIRAKLLLSRADVYRFGAERKREDKAARTEKKQGTARITPTLRRLKRFIKELSGEKLAELKQFLDRRELAMIERRVIPAEPETLEEIGGSFSIGKERARQIEGDLLDKIGRWKQGGEFGKKAYEGKWVKRIKMIIAQGLSKGEGIDRIKRDAMLNEAESQLLAIHVLAENRLSREETGGTLGKTIHTITAMLKRMEAKLLERHHRRRKGPNKGRVVKRIKRIVEELRRSGMTLNEIKRKAGLSGFERRVLNIYVLAKEHLKRKEAAERLGKSLSTVKLAVRNIKLKLILMRIREYRRPEIEKHTMDPAHDWAY